MSKKMSIEEVKLLRLQCDQLPRVPRLKNKLGDPLYIRVQYFGSTLVEKRELFIAAGVRLPYKIDPNERYGVDDLDYIDTYQRMRKAIYKGVLPEEVEKHNAEYALYTKRKIELAGKKEEVNILTEEQKQAEADAYQKEQNAIERRSCLSGTYRMGTRYKKRY